MHKLSRPKLLLFNGDESSKMRRQISQGQGKAKGRMRQGAKKPGGKRQGANESGGKLAKGRKSQTPSDLGYR